MRSLQESIEESLVIEAKRIVLNKLSDQELAYEFYCQWSGYNDGKSGLSGNPKAFKMSEEMHKRHIEKVFQFLTGDMDEYIHNNFMGGKVETPSDRDVKVVRDILYKWWDDIVKTGHAPGIPVWLP